MSKGSNDWVPGLVNRTTEVSPSKDEAFDGGVGVLLVSAADNGWLAYTHSEPLLAHREHCGVWRSHDNLDFAQASQDRRSVLRIIRT